MESYRLSEAQRAKIVSLRKQGVISRYIAERFDITMNTVYCVMREYVATGEAKELREVGRI